jgi:hypothetical protein
MFLYHLSDDAWVIAGGTTVTINYPQPAANVSAENFFHGTGFSGVERILSRFMGTSTLLQDIAGPLGNKGLEISIKQLMEAKFDDCRILY